MISPQDLQRYLNNLLEIDQFKDYCPNGLQVEGKLHITRLVTGVTASLALIEAALDSHADAILVHHGYFWKNENACITGIKQRRLKQLLAADVNLFAYHLPLDAHPQYGNNVQLAKRLGFQIKGSLAAAPLVLLGTLNQPIAGVVLSGLLLQHLAHEPIHVVGTQRLIEKVAWCTGGAQSYIEQAALHGVDAYISGEISEATTHIAREYGIDYFAAGHHATERYGVQALGEHLATHFKLNHHFIDIPNPA